LHSSYPKSIFTFKNLDIGSIKSINEFTEEIKKENWKLDVIVNNAAFGADFGDKVPDAKWARTTFDANVIGTYLNLFRNYSINN
jgi:short-subunit dehydrogenase